MKLKIPNHSPDLFRDQRLQTINLSPAQVRLAQHLDWQRSCAKIVNVNKLLNRAAHAQKCCVTNQVAVKPRIAHLKQDHRLGYTYQAEVEDLQAKALLKATFDVDPYWDSCPDSVVIRIIKHNSRQLRTHLGNS